MVFVIGTHRPSVIEFFALDLRDRGAMTTNMLREQEERELSSECGSWENGTEVARARTRTRPDNRADSSCASLPQHDLNHALAPVESYKLELALYELM